MRNYHLLEVTLLKWDQNPERVPDLKRFQIAFVLFGVKCGAGAKAINDV